MGQPELGAEVCKPELDLLVVSYASLVNFRALTDQHRILLFNNIEVSNLILLHDSRQTKLNLPIIPIPVPVSPVHDPIPGNLLDIIVSLFKSDRPEVRDELILFAFLFLLLFDDGVCG